MSQFGRGLYGRNPYSGTNLTSLVASPIVVYVYDPLWSLKGLQQTGASGLLSISFSHNEKGCSQFVMEFDKAVDIDKKDIIMVSLFNSARFFFCGVVRGTPISGSTAESFVYTGFGLNDYFVRLNAESRSYSTKTVEYIVTDLLTNVVVAKSPIKQTVDNLQFPAITVTSFDINYSQVSDALDALATIASSGGVEYAYGVDCNGYFFFRPKSTAVRATLVVGKKGRYGIEAYEPSDAQEARTKLFVLRNDGTYLTTLTSGVGNDVYEEKVRGAELSDADLTLWATGYLLKKENETRTATVQWIMDQSEPDFVVADGTVRVLSSVPSAENNAVTLYPWGDDAWGDGLWGGEDYGWKNIDDTLQIKEIAYEFSGQGGVRTLTLGALPDRIEDAVASINKKLTDLEISLGV